MYANGPRRSVRGPHRWTEADEWFVARYRELDLARQGRAQPDSYSGLYQIQSISILAGKSLARGAGSQSG
jgi:hypothetical protein